MMYTYPTNCKTDILNNWNKFLVCLKCPRQCGGSDKISGAPVMVCRRDVLGLASVRHVVISDSVDIVVTYLKQPGDFLF